MKFQQHKKLLTTTVTTLMTLTVCASLPIANASDTEIYIAGQNKTGGGQLLLMLDNTPSMSIKKDGYRACDVPYDSNILGYDIRHVELTQEQKFLEETGGAYDFTRHYCVVSAFKIKGRSWKTRKEEYIEYPYKDRNLDFDYAKAGGQIYDCKNANKTIDTNLWGVIRGDKLLVPSEAWVKKYCTPYYGGDVTNKDYGVRMKFRGMDVIGEGYEANNIGYGATVYYLKFRQYDVNTH